MTIPLKVKVGAMTYTVEVVPYLYAQRSLYGEVTYGDQAIVIAGDISPERQFNAYLHELTHAILFETGNYELNDDEQFVRSFSNMMTSIAVDNGWDVATETVACVVCDKPIEESDGFEVGESVGEYWCEECVKEASK